MDPRDQGSARRDRSCSESRERALRIQSGQTQPDVRQVALPGSKRGPPAQRCGANGAAAQHENHPLQLVPCVLPLAASLTFRLRRTHHDDHRRGDHQQSQACPDPGASQIAEVDFKVFEAFTLGPIVGKLLQIAEPGAGVFPAHNFLAVGMLLFFKHLGRAGLVPCPLTMQPQWTQPSRIWKPLKAS